MTQGGPPPGAKHSGPVRGPAPFGLLHHGGDELCHNGWGPAPLTAVMMAADQHMAIWKKRENGL